MFATNRVSADRSELGQHYVLSGDPRQEVGELKERFSGDMVIAVSAQLVHSLVALDLVDQLDLMAFPTVLGSGKRLFADGVKALPFALVDAKQSSAVVILRFGRSR
jgi:dihydrofolate reductase